MCANVQVSERSRVHSERFIFQQRAASKCSPRVVNPGTALLPCGTPREKQKDKEQPQAHGLKRLETGGMSGKAQKRDAKACIQRTCRVMELGELTMPSHFTRQTLPQYFIGAGGGSTSLMTDGGSFGRMERREPDVLRRPWVQRACLEVQTPNLCGRRCRSRQGALAILLSALRAFAAGDVETRGTNGAGGLQVKRGPKRVLAPDSLSPAPSHFVTAGHVETRTTDASCPQPCWGHPGGLRPVVPICSPVTPCRLPHFPDTRNQQIQPFTLSHLHHLHWSTPTTANTNSRRSSRRSDSAKMTGITSFPCKTLTTLTDKKPAGPSGAYQRPT